MNNIVKFPKPARPSPAPGASLNMEKVKAAMPKASTIKGILSWVWLIVRLPVFLVLYWLRFPVVFICNIISIPLLIAFLFSLYAFPDKHAMIWGFGIVSFIAFVIEWIYDFVLMALSPQPIMRTL